MLEKTFDPQSVEPRLYEQWEASGAFKPTDDPAAEPACTYLVAYTGRAEDLNAWLAYYIAHHPPIMRRFPGIRGIEICTRLDWCSFLPCRRVEYMQRNKNVLDSPEALNAAINSPVRHEMRADFHKFPAFQKCRQIVQHIRAAA